MNNVAKIRPLFLAKILFERTDEDHYLTTNQLVEILETEHGIQTHRQTIKSDIELLQHFGFEIQEVKSRQNKYNVINRLFDIPEIKLLMDAVESSKLITKKKSEQLVEKLTRFTGEHNAALLKRNLCVENQIKPNNEKIYLIVDRINDAINKNNKISFQYFHYNEHKEQILKHDGEPYIFSPLYLIWNGDYYYMVGVFDDHDQKIGCFRVDRIANCPELLDETALAAPDDFNINDYLNTTFRMFNSDHCTVELQCDNSVMDAIIDRFGEEVETHELDDSTFIACVEVATSHIFYNWIFGFGGLVKIKGPEEVKAGYAELVEAAYKALD